MTKIELSIEKGPNVHNKLFNGLEINLPVEEINRRTIRTMEKKEILKAIFQIALLFTTLWLIIALDFYYLQIFEARRDKTSHTKYNKFSFFFRWREKFIRDQNLI